MAQVSIAAGVGSSLTLDPTYIGGGTSRPTHNGTLRVMPTGPHLNR
jgi:hypothetical protein